VLRFPNPGSTIENFVSVYGAAFERLNGHTVDLDEIVATVVAANLATSSGYMGEEAVARSTRADRSRDPLYNQLKMYAELFRILGWLHPTPQSALNFTFTLLGQQVVAAGRDFGPLLEECVLGIVYPTPILAVKGEFDLRPFAFILRVMAACDGHLSRDEMIIGPLSAASDRGKKNLDTVVATIEAARESAAASGGLADVPGNQCRGFGFGFFRHVFSPWFALPFRACPRRARRDGAASHRKIGGTGRLRTGEPRLPVDGSSARAWQGAQAAR